MNLWNLTIFEILELVSGVVTIIGIPIAVTLFFLEKRRERLDREYNTYREVNRDYMDYLLLCLEHPDLDVFDVPLERENSATKEQIRKEQIIYEILLTMLERAFLLYEDKSKKIREEQWTGWHDYIIEWCHRENFVKSWHELGINQYDADFVAYIKALVPEHIKF